MTSEQWSSPVLLVPESRMVEIAEWRPLQREQCFAEGTKMLSWMDRFETSLSEDRRQKHAADIVWLRRVMSRRDPAFTEAPSVDRTTGSWKSLMLPLPSFI